MKPALPCMVPACCREVLRAELGRLPLPLAQLLPPLLPGTWSHGAVSS
jgi:hypothetical protein